MAKIPRRRIRLGGWIVGVVWMGAIAAAMVRISQYANTPGAPGAPPAQWPAQSAIRLDTVNPTLVMFAHPKCPCTRASIGELDRLMTLCQGKVNAQVVFVRPVGLPVDWEKTDLWSSASAIPGVSVRVDDKGVEATRFHIETSGDTLVYDPRGKLMFHGGITISRGHWGDSPGSDGILSLVNHQSEGGIVTPAFGCSLLGAAAGDLTGTLTMGTNVCKK